MFLPPSPLCLRGATRRSPVATGPRWSAAKPEAAARPPPAAAARSGRMGRRRSSVTAVELFASALPPAPAPAPSHVAATPTADSSSDGRPGWNGRSDGAAGGERLPNWSVSDGQRREVEELVSVRCNAEFGPPCRVLFLPRLCLQQADVFASRWAHTNHAGESFAPLVPPNNPLDPAASICDLLLVPIRDIVAHALAGSCASATPLPRESL